MTWYDMTYFGWLFEVSTNCHWCVSCWRYANNTRLLFLYIFILCFLTIHFKCSHISLVLVSWNSEYSCFTWNGVLAWPGRHENLADGGPPSWDGRCIEDLARWNQGQLMGDETNAIPKYTKMTVLWSRSCWTVASVAVLGVYAFCVIGSCGDDTDVLDAKYTGTFAYVKQRAPVAVSDRAVLYIYICTYVYIYIYIYIHTAKLTKIVVSSEKLTYVEWQNHWMLHIIYCIVCTVVCVESYN